MRYIPILLLSFLLVACWRSPTSQFYVLNPIAPQQQSIKNKQGLRIGINEIQNPAYMTRPEFIIHNTPNGIKVEEFHRWVENLSKNTRRVIEANLATLLPGAVILSAPWDFRFKPDYQLQINISQFEVSNNGDSVFRAEYLIYSANQLKKKGTLYYHQKVQPVNIENLVISMNSNLNHFTQDLAKQFY